MKRIIEHMTKCSIERMTECSAVFLFSFTPPPCLYSISLETVRQIHFRGDFGGVSCAACMTHF
jgi:hypothetical protein